jgi:hypothetical protein
MLPSYFASAFVEKTRRETYLMHFASSGEEALDRLAEQIHPVLVAVLSDIDIPGMLQLLGETPGSTSPDCDRLWRLTSEDATPVDSALLI